jgi:hypothetical protein
MAVASSEKPGYLTERDLEISAWVGRLLGASAEQIGRRFHLGRTQLYRRLRVLQAYGLLRRRRLLIGRPALYVGPGRRLRPASYEHALAVAELLVEREVAGAEVITEQELRRVRAHRRVVDDSVSYEDGRTILGCDRVPDMAERDQSGGLVAYEIELSSKGRHRRERVLSAYAASGYETVRWIVPDGRIRELVRTEILGNGLEDFTEVVGAVRELPLPEIVPLQVGAA